MLKMSKEQLNIEEENEKWSLEAFSIHNTYFLYLKEHIHT